MKLQEITANIRLRSPWEAVDLGFAMVQTWWKSIYIPLAIVTLTIASVLYLLVPEEQFWLTGVIFWWLKPLYDRLVLHIISHKLFNEELTSWQALKAIPSLIWNTGFFQSLTFRRFSLSRGFNLPIWQLERLRGKERAKRQRVLHQATHSQAVWLTIAMLHLEIFLELSLFVLIALFMPENTFRDFLDGLFNPQLEYKVWIDYLNYVFYVLVVTFLHPFYIAGNFALYINRRTQLEAWDVELDFRKMAMRIKNLLTSGLKAALTPDKLPIPLLFCIFLLAALGGSPYSAHADTPATANDSGSKQLNDETEFVNPARQPPETSKKVIEEVMLSKNLNDKKKVKRWVRKEQPKKQKTETTESSFSLFIKDMLEAIALFISKVIEFGLWILIAIGIILLIYYRQHWLHFFQGKGKSKDSYQAPEVMFGMDVRAKSLPKDIIGAAQKLWHSGKHRAALSLLYRGALVRLINKEKVRLKDSYTEGDVLRHASKQLPASRQRYLSLLTAQWKLIAYAHRTPAEADMQHLFRHWSSDFAIDTPKNTAKSIAAKDADHHTDDTEGGVQ